MRKVMLVTMLVLFASVVEAQVLSCTKTGNESFTLDCVPDLRANEPDFEVEPLLPVGSSMLPILFKAVSRSFGMAVVNVEFTCPQGYTKEEVVRGSYLNGVMKGKTQRITATGCSNFTHVKISPAYPDWTCEGCIDYTVRW